jgi:hypothetical protein
MRRVKGQEQLIVPQHQGTWSRFDGIGNVAPRLGLAEYSRGQIRGGGAIRLHGHARVSGLEVLGDFFVRRERRVPYEPAFFFCPLVQQTLSVSA